MKKILLFASLTLILMSCGDETLAPTIPIDDMPDADAMPLQAGDFSSGPYGSVSGTARLFKNTDGSFDVKLENFNTTNGPDLYVYLSKEIMPVNFISLGMLKSTNGNQLYSVPGTPDFTEYKYVCIHCKEYNHLFGYALID